MGNTDVNFLQLLIAFLERQLAERTAEELECLREELDQCGVDPAVLLENFSDEALALAIQKNFWWVEAFDVLFRHRAHPEQSPIGYRALERKPSWFSCCVLANYFTQLVSCNRHA